ncbi:MAG: hypothetical protein JXP72_02270 [Coriobacteriia bacterium]|nr:hypothetical protein [Coriobacteriia bacterium]
MSKRLQAFAGTGAFRWWIVAAFAAVAVVAPAFATSLTVEFGGDVHPGKCLPCHADYATAESPDYAFTHGGHLTHQCTTCHPRFPHTASGTDVPVMRDCFNCHGLYHGPQGVIAGAECESCHGDAVESLRPVSHRFDWSGVAHVEPALAGLTTECSMCHEQSACDSCHVAEGVAWSPAEPMVYDAGSGCLVCHGSPNLQKNTPDGLVSFHVTGLEDSAHADLTCPQCHIDFGYAEPAAPTKLWYVNVGMACAEGVCHDHDDQVEAYAASVHGVALAAGDYGSATCGACHGGHDIARLDTDEANTALHFSSEAMCARCHKDRWDNYNDAYHGAAYKRGADDAPSCWDCHPAHDALPSSDPKSSTHPARLAATCASCHQHADATSSFAAGAADTIHQQEDLRAENPLHRLLSTLPGSW